MRIRTLSAVLFMLAGLCVVYFGIIIGYSGFGTPYCAIWLAFALILSAMGFFSRSSLKHRDDMPRFLPIFVYTTFCAALLGFFVIMHLVMSASRSAEDRNVDYCIVMGARVYSNGISRTLLYRLDRAYEVYEANPAALFILSGGKEAGDAVPEAFAMYNYLSMKGIPGHHMIMDPVSTSTSDIINRAAVLIREDTDRRKTPKGPGDHVWAADYEPAVGILTSNYHIFRCMMIALERDIRDPVAIPARSDNILYLHNCVRESAAIVRDFFMGKVTVDESHLPEVPIKRNKAH